MPYHTQSGIPSRAKAAPQTRWSPAQLANVQRELADLAAAGHLSAQASAILHDLLSAAKSPLSPVEQKERERVWNEIEAVWPQVAEAMLSRLSEILLTDNRMKSIKQGLAPRENIFD